MQMNSSFIINISQLLNKREILNESFPVLVFGALTLSLKEGIKIQGSLVL